MSEIYKALAQAQAAMTAVQKGATNAHFKNRYAELSDVMDAVLPALNAAGICLYQPIGADEEGRYVDTVLAHTSGEKLEMRMHLILGKSDMQALGSAITYARRYSILAMTGVAPADSDDDGEAAVARDQQRPERPPRQTQAARPAPIASPADVKLACDQMKSSTSLDELGELWGQIPRHVRAVPAVNAFKDAWKASLTPTPEAEPDGPIAAQLDDDVPDFGDEQ